MNADEWSEALTKTGICEESANNYADIFEDAKISMLNIDMIDKLTLNDMGIVVIGDVLSILKLGKKETGRSDQHSAVKLPSVKVPQLQAEMTSQQFRKFRVDWDVFTQMSNLPENQMNVQC